MTIIATNIPLPNVPPLPGVPALNRIAGAFTLAPNPMGGMTVNVPAIVDPLAEQDAEEQDTLNQTIEALANVQDQQWGIFDVNNNPLWVNPDSSVCTLSCVSVEFTRDNRVADFPMQAVQQTNIGSLEVTAPTVGDQSTSFTSYNKIQLPATPKVVLALSTLGGTEAESYRTSFLAAIEAASISTSLWNVVTPTATYMSYTIEKYSYARKAQKGVSLISVELALKEIRQATATVSSSPISNPQNPASSSQVSQGVQQTTAPQQSWLLQGANTFQSGMASTAQFFENLGN